MPSIHASLCLGESEMLREQYVYSLLSFHCQFARHFNQYRPDADARCVHISVELPAPTLSDFSPLLLWNWYVNREYMFGRIHYITDIKDEEQEIDFDNAICFCFTEHFDGNTGLHTLRLEFDAEVVSFCDQTFENQ